MNKSSLCVHLQACMVTERLSCDRNSSPQERLGSAGRTAISNVMWIRCLLFVSTLYAPIAIGKKTGNTEH